MPKKCIICGSNTSIIQDKQFNINYFHCHNCEFIQLDNKSRISFEMERKIYDLHENSIDNEGYVKMFKDFIEHAVIPYKSHGSLLDFGSGPEPVLIQILNRDYNFETEYYDLHFQPEKIYLNKQYQVILSTEVIEHLPNPIKVFELFYELLEYGGILSIMTLFHYNDVDKFLNWHYRRDETHISFFNITTLKFIADIVGFELIYTNNKRICTFKKI